MTTVIDGTTGIDKVKDGSIVQADLGPNVAGNGPAFSAYSSINQNIPLSTDTIVLFDAKQFDLSNAYNPATGRFQPTMAGYYQLNAGLEISVSGMSLGSGSIRKNGTIIVYLGTLSVAFTGLPHRISGACLAYLNGTTDSVDVAAYGVGNSGAAVAGTFSGFLARAA